MLICTYCRRQHSSSACPGCGATDSFDPSGSGLVYDPPHWLRYFDYLNPMIPRNAAFAEAREIEIHESLHSAILDGGR